MLGKSDGINNRNVIHFDKVKSNLVVHFFFIRLNNRKRFIHTVELGEIEREKTPNSLRMNIHITYISIEIYQKYFYFKNDFVIFANSL